MKISKVNTSPAFCKVPVMTCKIKSVSDNRNNNATLYKLNTNDSQDLNDVRYSKTAQAICDSFVNAFYSGENYNQFYILQNDKSGEVISCAEISRHYRNNDVNNPGMSTIIENFAENK